MIWGGHSVRVFASREPADLRKGFEGLSALVRASLGHDPTSGDLFLFVSRNRLRAKVLLWDGTGLCLYSKRLETGRFAALWQRSGAAGIELTSAELSLFLDGCELVGRERLSRARVDPKRLLASGLRDTRSLCSTSPESVTPRS